MRTRNMQLGAVLGVLALAAIGAPAWGRNVDLATVPPRESVQLTIYNSEDLTLVREVRSLTLKKGANMIQYSWADTLIDPTSVEIRPLEKEEQIEVLDTTFPGYKPQHLVWHIESGLEGQVKFEVTYFTSGLSWTADYVLTANPGETEMGLDGYVQIYNNSGEDYENAQVRLVVGVVNLVQKIRELAQKDVTWTEEALGEEKEQLQRGKQVALLGMLADADRLSQAANRPAEIVKEGLSEYFIYTIEGEHTVANRWSQRMASFQARQVKFDILYRIRPEQYGERPVRFFMLKNDEEHKLGTTPLPDGLVRVFRDNGRDGLRFLGQQQVTYVPIKGDIELNVGMDDEVVWEPKVMTAARSNFTLEEQPRPLHVVGWDQAFGWREEIRNYKEKGIRVEVRHVIPGDIELKAEGAKLHDFQTVEFVFEIGAGQKLGWEYAYTQHLGKNARQNRIRLQ